MRSPPSALSTQHSALSTQHPVLRLPFRRGAVSAIGLDVGRTAARAVQLSPARGTPRGEKRWTLVNAMSWHLTGEADPDDRWGSLSERLRRAFRHQDFAGRTVVVGLSQPDVELHAVEVPRAQAESGDTRADSAIRWEIERLSRLEEEKQTAHWWLPRGRGGGPAAIGAAVPAAGVKDIWEACRRAGALCRAVDTAACALSRAASLLRAPGPDEVWGVLDLGTRATRLILCIDDVPVLARSLDTGGEAWTGKVAAVLQVSPEAAEQHKQDYGLGAVTSDPGQPERSARSTTDHRLQTGATNELQTGATRAMEDRAPQAAAQLAGMILSALRPELNRIVGEVERSYEYVLQCYPGRKAADLILAGGGSSLKGLARHLADRLGIGVAGPEAYLHAEGCRLSVNPSVTRRRDPLAVWLAAIGLAIHPEPKR